MFGTSHIDTSLSAGRERETYLAAGLKKKIKNLKKVFGVNI